MQDIWPCFSFWHLWSEKILFKIDLLFHYLLHGDFFPAFMMARCSWKVSVVLKKICHHRLRYCYNRRSHVPSLSLFLFHPALLFLFSPTFVIRVLPHVLQSVCAFHWRCIYQSCPLSSSPSSRQCNPFEYQGDCWQWRDTWEHKKPPAGFKGQGGEEGSDSGKELSPYMQLNKATVRGGRALIHKHTKTAGGIHTWEWWEEKRKTYSIICYNR